MRYLRPVLSCFIFCVVVSFPSVGKTTEIEPLSSHTKGRDKQTQLDRYVIIRGTEKGADFLDHFFAARKAIGFGELKIIRESLASRITERENVTLVELLGDAYRTELLAPARTAILLDLRTAIQSLLPAVRRAAVLSFARAGHFHDTLNVLQSAFKDKTITQDELYGEIALTVRFANAYEQLQLIEMLKEARNTYAMEVLVGDLTIPSVVAKLNLESVRALTELLSLSEPAFGEAIGEYGLTEALRFKDWLNVLCMAKERLGPKTYHELVLEHLAKPNTDPRKIIAFFDSSEGNEVRLRFGMDKRYVEMMSRATSFARSFPGNHTIEASVISMGVPKSRLQD